MQMNKSTKRSSTIHPANMLNPAEFCLYVPWFVSLPSLEPVIQGLSFVDVLHICFSFIFVHKLGC